MTIVRQSVTMGFVEIEVEHTGEFGPPNGYEPGANLLVGVVLVPFRAQCGHLFVNRAEQLRATSVTQVTTVLDLDETQDQTTPLACRNENQVGPGGRVEAGRRG